MYRRAGMCCLCWVLLKKKIMNQVNALSDKFPVMAFVPRVERSFKKQKKITFDYEIVFKKLCVC